MTKAEQPEKSDHPTFRRREHTVREAGKLILCYGTVGMTLSIGGVSATTHGEHDDVIPVVEVPEEVAEGGPPMPNFDFIIPRRQTPGITYLLSTDPEARLKGEVTEGVQYAGYGAVPQEDLFLLDTGAKITRHGDDVEVLPLYGPDHPIQLPHEVLARAPSSVAFDTYVLTVGTAPTDPNKIIDYIAPRNVFPPQGMFKQQG